MYGSSAEVVESLGEPDLLIVVLVLSLSEPGQQRLHWLQVLDLRLALGGVLTIGGHGEYGVESVVVCGTKTTHYVKQFPRNTIKT